jgi:hypothetical protein
MKIVILLFLLIFTYDSELFNVYLGGSYVDLLKIVIFLTSLHNLTIKKFKGNKQEDNVIFLLVLIHLYLSSITVIYVGLIEILWVFKFFLRFYFLYYIIQNFKEYHLNIFIKWYRTIAIILSIQSILLFIIIYLDIPLESTDVTRHSDEDIFRSFGVFGFANVNTGYSFRTQSFFSEATNFSKFLILPFFSYLNEFLTKKNKYLFLKTSIIFTALLSTFSVTAFVGVIMGLISLFILKNIGKRGLLISAIIFSLSFFGLYKAVFVLIDLGIDKETTNIFIGSFQKGDVSVSQRLDYLYSILTLVSENPFGVGYYFKPFLDGTLPMAPTKWLVYGGWFGLFLVILLHISFIMRWTKSLSNKYYLVFFVVCITHFIISLIHGGWMEFVYWINFILLLKISEWNKVNYHK